MSKPLIGEPYASDFVKLYDAKMKRVSDLRLLVKDAVKDFSDIKVNEMLLSLSLKSKGSRSKKVELIEKKLDTVPESKLLMLKKMYNIEG